MPRRLDTSNPKFEVDFELFVSAKRDIEEDVDAVAASIINDVRQNGDQAVAAYTEKFDRLTLTPGEFTVDPRQIDEAVDACDPKMIRALELAASRIRAFHETQLPEALEFKDSEGVKLGARWTPLDAVGLYVPGGTASYPSSVLMNAVPANVAGVQRIVTVVGIGAGSGNGMTTATRPS